MSPAFSAARGATRRIPDRVVGGRKDPKFRLIGAGPLA
jgi:hypothetical protein